MPITLVHVGLQRLDVAWTEGQAVSRLDTCVRVLFEKSHFFGRHDGGGDPDDATNGSHLSAFPDLHYCRLSQGVCLFGREFIREHWRAKFGDPRDDAG